MNQTKVGEELGTLCTIGWVLVYFAHPDVTVDGTEAIEVSPLWLASLGELILARVSDLTRQVFGNESPDGD